MATDNPGTPPEPPQGVTPPPAADSDEGNWKKLEDLIDKSVEKAVGKHWTSKGNSTDSSGGSGTGSQPEQKKKSFLEKLISG